VTSDRTSPGKSTDLSMTFLVQGLQNRLERLRKFENSGAADGALREEVRHPVQLPQHLRMAMAGSVSQIALSDCMLHTNAYARTPVAVVDIVDVLDVDVVDIVGVVDVDTVDVDYVVNIVRQLVQCL
jgi:hypothetical protein